ncbi:MAG: ribonuclease III [Lachnospiraceae bacterium]|nr:ribonuclease III [Lachnospiraceae bacterium]
MQEGGNATGTLRPKTSLLEDIKTCFACEEKDVRTYSPLALAYIGDAIYDLIIRSVVVERANRSANDLHRMAVRYVKAETQAKLAMALLEHLTEDEATVYKRGRNAKSYTIAKNASRGDYRKATGLEALFGYLYLTDQMDRLLYLVKSGIEWIDMTL